MGYRGIDTVLVIEIDGVNSQPLQATLASFANIRRRAIHSLYGPVFEAKAELRCDNNLLSPDLP